MCLGALSLGPGSSFIVNSTSTSSTPLLKVIGCAELYGTLTFNNPSRNAVAGTRLEVPLLDASCINGTFSSIMVSMSDPCVDAADAHVVVLQSRLLLVYD